MRKMIKYAASVAVLFAFAEAGAQSQEFPISDGGTVSTNNCQHTIVITDSNADSGNYLPNETHEATVCFNTVEGNPLQFSILPTDASGANLWDVDGESTLFVYAGDNTGAPLIGAFNSVSDPNGVYFTTESACLTFVFISGSTSSGEGFRADITCAQALQPFNANVITEEPHGLFEDTIPGLEGENVVVFCFMDTLRFTAVPDFPLSSATGNGYEQLAEACTYIWDMGDGTVAEGVNLTEFEHVYTVPGGYYFRLRIIDVNGREERYDAYMLMAPRVLFSNVLFGDTLCIGDTTQITGGILGPDTVGVGPNTSYVSPNFNFTDSIAIPDGAGVDYFTEIDIFGYSGDPIIEDASDFIEICMNVEHSYLGDLQAWLICPNDTEVLLFDGFNGPATNQYLGDAEDNSLGIPGVGFDYCFNDNAEWGTLMEELVAGNLVPVTMGNAMAPGTYKPEEDFSALEGCPVNGLWKLRIRDNLPIDDGFIFSWGVEFNPEFVIDTIWYTPDVVDAFWLDNPDIVINNDTIVTVVPSGEGPNSFTFRAIDSFGCEHDSVFTVYVRPDIFTFNDIACDLTHELVVGHVTGGAEWELVSGPTENSTAEFGDVVISGEADVEVNEYGIYLFKITEFNCNYQDTATIDFRPVPQIEPFVTDTVLCNNASITFDAGPQQANSENFIINWTVDGSNFNSSDYAVTVDETGQYILTIEGVCGSASDTSNVVAIVLEFEGDTLCGLDKPAVAVTLEPEGSGTWSAASEAVSFGNPSGLLTSINASAFGEYEVIFTDDRCPEDGEMRLFRFVQQPEIELSPWFPDFCVDLDSLHMETAVSGNHSGDFVWTINGVPSDVSEGSISFPPEEFAPLEEHVIEVRTNDEFFVCPIAVGSVSFTGQWCSYTIPNVLTPNGDGRNDTWDIEGIEFFPGTHVRVFNRWGQPVFDQTDYDSYQRSRNGRGWDPGDLSEGVYFYEVLIPAVNKTEAGNLSILRETVRRR